jgi:CBS domain-containing protein
MAERIEATRDAGVHLSAVLGQPVLSRSAERVGKVDDVIVHLRGADYPVVTGLVVKVGAGRVFVPIGRLIELREAQVELAKAKVDLRTFERREGEVLLREDILGHRLIDVSDAELVRAWDVELRAVGAEWVVSCLDTRRPARLLGLIRRASGHPCKDWKAFEPLVGHTPTVRARTAFGRVGRLKPAQIADLLEDASRKEGSEILGAVHADPELEADVFEELDPDFANRLFGDKTDAEVADVIAHMHADDGADAIAELPQARRQTILDLLPVGNRAKVMTLLGFNSTSAGGIMGVDFLTVPADTTVSEALRRIRLAGNVQPEALVTVHIVDVTIRLVATVSVVGLLQADPEAHLGDIGESDPVRVGPDADVVDVTLLMADHNLMTVPVVDGDDHLLGVITVDDVLAVTIPDDWRRREPPSRPEAAHSKPAAAAPEPEPNSSPSEDSEPGR